MPPSKVGGVGTKQRLTTDPALLVMSPDGVKNSIIHSGGNKRRRVGGGRVEARKGKQNDAGIQGGEDSREEEGEVYETIAVWAPPEVLELYKSWQRKDTPPEPPGVDKIGYNEEMENKDNGKVSDSLALKEAKSMEKSISDDGYIGRVTYQVVGRQIISQAAGGGLLHRRVEGDLVGGVVGHGVTGENYVESLGEGELIQQAITRAIYTRNLSQSLTAIGGVIEGPERPEKPSGIREEGEEMDEIHQLDNQEDLLILDEKTNTYQPMHPDPYDGDETESDPEQLYTSSHRRGPSETLQQGLELRSLTPSIGPKLWSPAQSPKLRRARPGPQLRPPTFLPTPSSISLVNSTPPPPSTLRSSPMPSIVVGSMPLTPVTGPKRWKRPLAKQSRFSGPKIYTPLTLHPPSVGLGVVDYTRTLPLQRDEGDRKWERPMRQVSEEL